MIQVNEQTHRFLQDLAELNGLTISEMIEKMISFWKENNEDSE